MEHKPATKRILEQTHYASKKELSPMRRNMFGRGRGFPSLTGVAFGLGLLLAVAGFFRVALFLAALALIYFGIFSR
jgi:hypothetical protein